MGDRTISMINCPKCNRAVELYDAPSCLQYIANCEKCGWREPHDYYDVGDNEIALCTKEEYAKRYKHTDWCREHRKDIANWMKRERRQGYGRQKEEV
jgi:hypothetical protein